MPKQPEHQYNPIAEIPEAALKHAADAWGKKSIVEMRQEADRLTEEMKQIAAAGDDVLQSNLLGGETASLEDRMGALTQRVATRHYLTEKLAEAAAAERQLKHIVGNMGNGKAGDDPLQQRMDTDPLGYEKDRGVEHAHKTNFDHLIEQLELDQLDDHYPLESNPSPLFTQLLRGVGFKHSLSPRLMHATATTAAGVTAERAPDRRRIELPFREPELLDFLPREMEPTAVYTWIDETAFSGAEGNAKAAKAVAEGTKDLAEATIADARKTVEIPRVVVTLPATYEQLNNTNRARRVIDAGLPRMVEQQIDSKAITDLIALAGAYELTADLAEDRPNNMDDKVIDTKGAATLILRAQIEEVLGNGKEKANLCLFSPRYYTRFLTEESDSGGYLIRSSSELAPVKTAWGVPVALVTEGLSYGKKDDVMAAVGNFADYGVLAYAEESNMRILDQHADEAAAMIYRFQAWWRAIVIYLKATAFCRIKSA